MNSFDLTFLELKCGDTVLTPQFIKNSEDGTNSVMSYPNYSCDQNGSETSRVHTIGKHHLEFKFGDEIQYANNDATTITLNFPADGNIAKYNYRPMNATVSSVSALDLNVSVFAGTSSNPSDLVGFFSPVTSGSSVDFNYNTPVVQSDANLVGFWRLDKNIGDYSGRGNNGTGYVATMLPTGGRSGGAFSFDGVNDYVAIADANSLDVRLFTLSFWIKGYTAPESTKITRALDKGENFTFNWGHSAASARQSLQYRSGTSWKTTKIAKTLLADTWYHVVFTYNGTDLNAFVNGVYDAKSSPAATPNVVATRLTIGNDSTLAYDFNGVMDEVAIWDRVLTPSEISSLYSLGNGTYYWNVQVTDGIDTNTSATRSFTISNTAPGVTLNFPADGNVAKYNYRPINVTATDYDLDDTNVSVFGGTSASPTDLVGFFSPVTS
ncbi:MAG: LamG domain-containing protein, partial [Nitrosarchaeum sp.]|nr:LamG domain-containing protein [Nitrosarchaeum sp.]